MYGTQAMLMVCMEGSEFENDIKMYGTQATGEDFLRKYLQENHLEEKMKNATHIAWATGGSLVPEAIREEYKNTYLEK